MDYKYCDYKGRYVNNAKEYLNAIRNNCFNIAYDCRNRKKMIEEIESLIDFNKSVDLYAFARLLYEENDKYGITRCSSILDIIASWDYAPAKYLLGQLYYYGMSYEKDLDKFFTLTKEASNANFMPSKNALAYAYLNGEGCNVNIEKGLELLEDCVNANYGHGYYNIGYCYYSGSFGYSKDVSKAFNYYKMSAEQYYSPGCYNVGLMYLSGIGCSKSVDKGIEQLTIAACLGHVRSQKKLGDIYYFGEITKRNYNKAFEFYLMAAENGDAYSMYSVGYMIVKKEITTVDRYVGIRWLTKAVDAGYENAQKLLDNL